METPLFVLGHLPIIQGVNFQLPAKCPHLVAMHLKLNVSEIVLVLFSLQTQSPSCAPIVGSGTIRFSVTLTPCDSSLHSHLATNPRI